MMKMFYLSIACLFALPAVASANEYTGTFTIPKEITDLKPSASAHMKSTKIKDGALLIDGAWLNLPYLVKRPGGIVVKDGAGKEICTPTPPPETGHYIGKFGFDMKDKCKVTDAVKADLDAGKVTVELHLKDAKDPNKVVPVLSGTLSKK